MFAWSDEAIAMLKKLNAEDRSASWIGKYFGITRSAVLGKLHRLGLRSTGGDGGGDVRGNGRMVRKGKRLGARVPPTAPIGTERRVSSIAAAPLPPPILPRAESCWTGIAAAVCELKPQQCRWPMGEPVSGFCRARTDLKASYCPYHMHVAANGTPGAKSGRYTQLEQRGIVLQHLVNTKLTRTSHIAEELQCTAEDATLAIQRTRAFLRDRGITLMSAQGSGYWLSAQDKASAIALVKRAASLTERGKHNGRTSEDEWL